MNTFPVKLLIAVLGCSTVFPACSSNPANQNANLNVNTAQTANSNDSNSVSDDLEDLKQRVKMPFEPEEFVWREETANGKQKLTAVLRFAPEDANKLEQQAATDKPAAPVVIDTESWYPAELIAQSQISGDETLKGKTYAPNDFIQPPFTGGRLTRIENSDYFVLELN